MTKRWSWLLAASLVGVVAPMTTASAGNEENETENETIVSMDKIPAAARDALLKAAAGAPMVDVVQETEHGQTVYEAHVRKGNDLLGITVDARGKVLETENETGEPAHK
jgi:uncharacterized membrane protein YkoI